MEKEVSPVASVSATEEKPVVDVVTPTPQEPQKPEKEEEEIVDEDLSEFGVPPMPDPKDFEEEEKPAVPESKDPVPVVAKEAPKVEPIIAPREASSIDKRIAKLYQETQVLQGNDAPETEAILDSIKGGTFAEKKAALHRLLADRKTLRGGENDGVVEMSDEDREALIDAQAEEKFQAMQSEIVQKEWNDDLVKTVESHPELRPDTKEYNPLIEGAVEKLVKNGMKASEAYDLVTSSISSAQDKTAQDEKNREEIKRQKALSGAVSVSNDFSKKGKEMNWIEFDKLRTEDPARYEKLLDEGFEPSDE